MDPRTDFGARVRSLRKSKGWSQEKLAAETGLDRTYIGGVERGERRMNLAAEQLSTWVEEAQEAIIAVSEKNHPLLANVVKKNGLIDVRSTRDGCIVQFLAGTVVSQQLSSQASSTIWSRVCENSSTVHPQGRPT
jgi:transcriptional regulator with XRE-family HTH domain